MMAGIKNGGKFLLSNHSKNNEHCKRYQMTKLREITPPIYCGFERAEGMTVINAADADLQDSLRHEIPEPYRMINEEG